MFKHPYWAVVAVLVLTAGIVFAFRTATMQAEAKIKPEPQAEVGKKAPDFTLKGTKGANVTLSQLKGKNVLLAFYPMDNTPGCTIQLCSLRDNLGEYKAQNTEVFGINPGSLDSHEGFSAKHSYTFPLLTDEGGKVTKAYGVMGFAGMPSRSVFLIDKEGIIRYMQAGTQNDQEMIEILSALNKGQPIPD
jgi:thioredoxin-dependent peroxiredoxin